MKLQWPDDLQLLLSLDSDDLSSHYPPESLCECGVHARQGVVPSELGYGYFCGNVVGEDDAWVSSYSRNCNYFFCNMWFISALSMMVSIESFYR
jgi:hypothetical protein